MPSSTQVSIETSPMHWRRQKVQYRCMSYGVMVKEGLGIVGSVMVVPESV